MKLPTLLLVAALWTATGAHAGLEPMKGCTDSEGDPVPTEDDSSQDVVVRASVDEDGALITVNYELASRQYIGRHTLRWLYFRECAHIALEHDLGERMSPASQEAADCWALERLFEDGKEWESRKVMVSIERDLEELDSDQWEGLGLGQRRDPEIGFRCGLLSGKKR